jgi:hypothetical protein
MKSLAVALLILSAASATRAHAQVRASEPGTVSQVVSGTTITIEYSRPGVRGRAPVFPGVVHYGEVWTPGANWATTLEVSSDVELNGQRIPKGKYSIWMVPQEKSWTVRISKTSKTYHTRRPDPANDQASFQVAPVQGAHMENLAFYFPSVRKGGTELRMHWGTTVVPLDITVPVPGRTAFDAATRALYVGEYVMRMTRDTVKTYNVRVVEEGEFLRAYVDPMFFDGYDPYFDLNLRGAAIVPAMYQGGAVFDEEDLRFVFDVGSGRATGFTAYGPAGRAFAIAVRATVD